MFLSSLYVVLRAKHNIWADHQDVLSPDLFSHGSRSSTSRSDLLKLPNKGIRRMDSWIWLPVHTAQAQLRMFYSCYNSHSMECESMLFVIIFEVFEIIFSQLHWFL